MRKPFGIVLNLKHMICKSDIAIFGWYTQNTAVFRVVFGDMKQISVPVIYFMKCKSRRRSRCHVLVYI